MAVEDWTYTSVRFVNIREQVPYDRVRKKKGGVVHLAHKDVAISLCGIKLGGRREGDPKPIPSHAEPTCHRCRQTARHE